MTADAAQRLCPSCREPFERETIAGLASYWCPRCALLCATADELEAVARALRSEGDRARLPSGAGSPVNVACACAICGGKLYLDDRHAWVTCGGCHRIYVPKDELPALVDDPGLAHRRPLDMPYELTANDRRKDQRAFVVLGFASTLGALACFFLASQLWPAGSTPWASRAYDDTDGELAVYLLYAGFALIASAGGLFFKVLHPHSYWQKEAGPTDEYKDRAGTGPMS